MNEIVYAYGLTAHDASAVARLERTCHSRDVRQGKKELHERLKYVDKTACGLNLGLYAGTRLVGYILSREADAASGQEAAGESAGERVVHVDSVAVHPTYKRCFHQLLGVYLRYLQVLYPAHSIEAAAAQAEVDFARRHKTLFLHLGYEFAEPGPVSGSPPDQSRRTLLWWPVATNGEPDEDRGRRAYRARYSYRVDGQAYSVETWTDERAWHELKPYWNALLLKTPEPTIFQTYEYQRIWWRHFGLSRRLLILVIRDGHDVIGIAPLQVTPAIYYGKCFRELGFIGVNWEVDRPKFLFGDKAEICATVTGKFLKEQEQLWDLVRLYEQREDSFVLSSFRELMQGYGYLTAATKDAVAPYLRTDTTWEEFSKSLSARMRKNLKAARKKLAAMGKFEYVECATYPGVLEKLEWYKQIEQRSWKAAARVGPSKHGHYYRFFEALAREFGKTGQFHIRFLTLDEQPIAGTFGLELNNTFYSLHIAHDDAYSKYSLGTLLEYLELESCFTGDCLEYDFLGSFLNNKLRWTSTVRTSKELHVYQKHWQLVLLFLIYHRIKPFIKRIVMTILKDKVKVLLKYKEKYERAANRRPSEF